MPAVPACMKEMRCYWDRPSSHRVPVKGYSGLEIGKIEVLGLNDPPVVEQSMAYHLHASQRYALTFAEPALPGKMVSLLLVAASCSAAYCMFPAKFKVL